MSLNLVQFTGHGEGMASANDVIFPTTPFPFFLHSAWYCTPPGSPPLAGSAISFGSVNFFNFQVSANCNVAGPLAPTCELKLRNLTHDFFDAMFTLPGNLQWHMLVSVDCANQIVQVYCNDQPCQLASGGFTSPGMLQESRFPIIALDIGATGGVFPAIADLWEAAPPNFVDLSNEANRRKFINRDLTPANLGADGRAPFGYPPPIFCTAPSAPSDFLTNYGTGGAFNLSPGISLSFQAAGSCALPVPPEPEPEPEPGPQPPPPPPGPYLREMTYRRRFIGKSYDPSLTVRKSRPGPLRIVELDFWMSE